MTRGPNGRAMRRGVVAPALAIAAFLVACRAAWQARDRELEVRGELQAVPTTTSAPFGGARLGRAAWLSRNGNLAALYLIDRDTDGDGKIEARFGQHGEPSADEPHLWIFDLRTGAGTEYDALLSTQPTGRFVAVASGDRILLLDSETGRAEELAGPGRAAAPDENPCMPARQVAFDERGRRVALLEGESPVLVIRELATGQESRVVSTDGYLWRGGFAESPGWLRLLVVDRAPEGRMQQLPKQRTSCHCRHCSLFAASWGFYGFEGARFRHVLVTPDGRQIRTAGAPTVIGQAAYVVRDSTSASTLFGADGERIPLPSLCSISATVAGASRVLLRCADGAHLFDPVSRRTARVSTRLRPAEDATAVEDERGARWLPVFAAADSANTSTGGAPWYRLGRLRLDDGRVELGPPVEDATVSPSGDWVIGTAPAAVYPLDTRTGRLWRLEVDQFKRTNGLTLQTGTGTVLLLPASGQYFEVGKTASAATESGCVLEASARAFAIDTGPWVRRCARR